MTNGTCPPFSLRVQFGCTTVINIPAEDPDADSVRCRLATPEECGNACTNAPNITLNWVCCFQIFIFKFVFRLNNLKI